MEDVFMKRVISWVMAAGFIASCFATDARILTMGRHDDFFMDDYSIFRNPANINYYPNMLMGSMGVFLQKNGDTSSTKRINNDPQNPYGGTILSYSLNQSTEGGNQYPLLSVGAIFNRYDYMLDYINPKSDLFVSQFGANKYFLEDPVGKIDLIVGYAFPNGGMIGAGGYFAFQSEKERGLDYNSNLFKGNIGVNWPVAKAMNLEASIDISSLDGQGVIDSTDRDGGALTIADGDISVKGDVRLFSALNSLNGDFVPHLSIERIKLFKGKYKFTDVAGGLGINVNIDKGFFWAAVEGLYESKEVNFTKDTITSGVGGRISAGLERNVIWDWWVWRIGINKKVVYVSNGDDNGHWTQNTEADASDNDFFAFGWGLNIDNRFKVDAVIAEDVFYTWTNLISGTMHHLTNRITATYSF
jgi:hypothetical protein